MQESLGVDLLSDDRVAVSDGKQGHELRLQISRESRVRLRGDDGRTQDAVG